MVRARTRPGPITQRMYTHTDVCERCPCVACAAERFSVNAIMDERTYRENFLPAFRGAAEAGVSGYMCSVRERTATCVHVCTRCTALVYTRRAVQRHHAF